MSRTPCEEAGTLLRWGLSRALSIRRLSQAFRAGRYMTIKGPWLGPKRSASICAPISQHPKWGESTMTPWPLAKPASKSSMPSHCTWGKQETERERNHIQGNSPTICPALERARLTTSLESPKRCVLRMNSSR